MIILTKKIERIREAINQLPDEALNETIRDEIQEAWEHLQRALEELELGSETDENPWRQHDEPITLPCKIKSALPFDSGR